MTLKVLALGDSIMWGQGNSYQKKFVNLVCDWLTSRGKTAQPIFRAHSGAIAKPTPTDSAPPLWGEVPEAAPSVLAQSTGLDIDPSCVDIVLVNGGINDVSAFHIVVGSPFDTDGVAKLLQRTDDVFLGQVTDLVQSVVAKFATAKIVVLGYYPIVSAASAGRDLVKLMKMCPLPVGVPNTIDWVVEHLADDLIDAAITTEKTRMVEQCAAFHTRSDTLLRALVGRLAAASPGRIGYAVPAFEPENAYAAPSSWLWNGADDPLHDERVDRYAEQLELDPFRWPPYTPVASMCHPNEAGSRAYADAITGVLMKFGF